MRSCKHPLLGAVYGLFIGHYSAGEMLLRFLNSGLGLLKPFAFFYYQPA